MKTIYEVAIETDEKIINMRKQGYRENSDEYGLYLLAFVIDDEVRFFNIPHFTERQAFMNYMAYYVKTTEVRFGIPSAANIYKIDHLGHLDLIHRITQELGEKLYLTKINKETFPETEMKAVYKYWFDMEYGGHDSRWRFPLDTG